MNEEQLDKKLMNMTETIMGGIDALHKDLATKIDDLSVKVNGNKTEMLDKVSEMISQSETRIIKRIDNHEERIIKLEKEVFQ